MLRATCPYRFHEAGIVVSTIGKTLLGHEQPLVVKLDSVRYTKLETAVQGLTGGRARTQAEFEDSIRRKLGLAPRHRLG